MSAEAQEGNLPGSRPGRHILAGKALPHVETFRTTTSMTRTRMLALALLTTAALGFCAHTAQRASGPSPGAASRSARVARIEARLSDARRQIARLENVPV